MVAPCSRIGAISTACVLSRCSRFSFFTHFRTDYHRVGAEHGQALDLMAPENQWLFDDFGRRLLQITRNGKRLVVILASPRGDAFAPRCYPEAACLPR